MSEKINTDNKIKNIKVPVRDSRYIGNGPIRRLNPRIQWDELDEDIKNVITEEEEKVKKIFFPISDSNCHQSYIEGNFSPQQISQIETIHNNLQDEIKKIHSMQENDPLLKWEPEIPPEYIRIERQREYKRLLKYLYEFNNLEECNTPEKKLNEKIKVLIEKYIKKTDKIKNKSY